MSNWDVKDVFALTRERQPHVLPAKQRSLVVIPPGLSTYTRAENGTNRISQTIGHVPSGIRPSHHSLSWTDLCHLNSFCLLDLGWDDTGAKVQACLGHNPTQAGGHVVWQTGADPSSRQPWHLVLADVNFGQLSTLVKHVMSFYSSEKCPILAFLPIPQLNMHYLPVFEDVMLEFKLFSCKESPLRIHMAPPKTGLVVLPPWKNTVLQRRIILGNSVTSECRVMDNEDGWIYMICVCVCVWCTLNPAFLSSPLSSHTFQESQERQSPQMTLQIQSLAFHPPLTAPWQGTGHTFRCAEGINTR